MQLQRLDINQIELSHAILAASVIHIVVLTLLNFDYIAKAPSHIDQILEITVVQPEEEQEPPEQADFAARASQQGSGNQQEAVKPTQDAAVASPVEIKTDITNKSEFSPLQQKAREQTSDDKPVLTVDTISETSITQKPDETEQIETLPTPAQLLANTQKKIEELTAELDEKTRAAANFPNRGFITAATKEAKFADYFEMWRRKIERVGKMNYPAGHSGKVLVVMTVRSDGSLQNLQLQEPSDSSVINEAVREIARLASPFPPFNDDLRQEYDELVISRTWYFLKDTIETRNEGK